MQKSFKCRTIVFTAYTEEPQKYLEELQKHCDWVLGQLEECPTTHRKHIQGMAYAKNQSKWGFIKSHKEPCKDPLASVDYCTKADTRLDGPWEFGIRPTWNIKGQKLTNSILLTTPLTQLVDEERIKLTSLPNIYKAKQLYNIIKKDKIENRTEENLWIYGKPGTGKSRYVRDIYGESLYLKAQNKWWDGYEQEETVLIDDFDKQGECLSHYIKIWADIYPFNGEIKCGTIQIRGMKRFVITSNYTPSDIWKEDNLLIEAIERRFKLINM